MLTLLPSLIGRGASASRNVRPAGSLRRIVPVLILLLVFLSACAEGESPPQAMCDVIGRFIYTVGLFGGGLVIIGLLLLGFKKNLSSVLPSQGAQTAAIAGSIGMGLILVAFGTDIGDQIVTAFSLPSLIELCGL